MFDDDMSSCSTSSSLFDDSSHCTSINPASGLPMIGDGIGGFDVGGNLWGCDSSTDFLSATTHSLFDWES